MNSITKQLWPNVGHYTRKIIVESVEPAVKSALEGYGLSGFRFERVVLGQIPPRITGIKVGYFCEALVVINNREKFNFH